MVVPWHSTAVAAKLCKLLRPAPPRQRVRQMLISTPQYNEHVYAFLRLVPGGQLKEIVPGVRGIFLQPYLNTKTFRTKLLHYYRTEFGDGFGFTYDPAIPLKPPHFYPKELKPFDVDKFTTDHS